MALSTISRFLYGARALLIVGYVAYHGLPLAILMNGHLRPEYPHVTLWGTVAAAMVFWLWVAFLSAIAQWRDIKLSFRRIDWAYIGIGILPAYFVWNEIYFERMHMYL